MADESVNSRTTQASDSIKGFTEQKCNCNLTLRIIGSSPHVPEKEVL